MDWAFALVMDIKTTPGLGSALSELRDTLKTPPWPDADTWGATEQARQQAQAMADLAGGPATKKE